MAKNTRKVRYSHWSTQEQEQIEAFRKEDEESVWKENEPNSFSFLDQKIIYTPFGNFELNNPLKPSDRYDCWTCHTNFELTLEDEEKLNKIHGIAALIITDPYTFSFGIPKEFFKIRDVRKQIKEQICDR